MCIKAYTETIGLTSSDQDDILRRVGATSWSRSGEDMVPLGRVIPENPEPISVESRGEGSGGDVLMHRHCDTVRIIRFMLLKILFGVL